MSKKSTMQIKRGIKANLPILKDGQLGYCKDANELWIGNDGVNTLINEKSSAGNVTAEFIKLISPNGTEFKITISDSGEFIIDKVEKPVEPPTDGGDTKPPVSTEDYADLIINQVYGGNKANDGGTSCSHTFVELYNKSADKTINLTGLSVQVSGNGVKWQKAELSGELPPHHSYLIRGIEHTEPDAANVAINHFDLDTEFKLGKGMKAVVLKGTNLLTVENPFNIDGNGTKCEGYIDMIGVAGNDPDLTIDGFEGEYGTGEFTGNSKQKSIRRINFQDTDNNLNDCEIVDFRVMSVNFNKVPRYLAYGAWDEHDEIASPEGNTPLDPEHPSCISNTFGNDPKTTRNFTWQTTKDKKGFLEIGTDESSLTKHEAETTVVGDAAIHRVKLTDLTAGTTYTYRVGDGSEITDPETHTGWSKNYTFTTEAENPTSFSFVQLSDTQSTNKHGYELAANCLHGAIEKHSPDFVVNTGDLVQNGYVEQQWRDFFGTAQDSIGNIALMPVVGNNDVTGENNFSNFENHFTLPSNGSIPTCYSFDYGNAHITVLNSHTGNVEEQKTWADKDLAATDKKWKIVCIHKAPYTSFKEDTFPMASIFEKHGVDLVICGHKHMYMRSYPMKNDQKVEPGQGVRYVMCNASGAKQGKLDDAQPWMEIRKAPMKTSFNFITVNENNITLTSNTIENGMVDTIATIDTLEITK